MRLGIGLFSTEPAARMRDLAHIAEDLGYSHAWFGDSQCLWRDPYVSMGIAAEGTSRIVFGTGVTNLITRHTTVMASVWLTLYEQTGGRVAVGLGAGDSSVSMIGSSPLNLAEMEAGIGDLRALFEGRAVPSSSGKDLQMGFATPATIPLYVACSGPKMLQMAGRIADGVILLVGTNPVFIDAGVANIEKGARAAGRSLDDIDIVLWTPTAVLAEGDEARQLVKSHVARVAMHPLPAQLDADAMAAIEQVRAAYDYRKHMSSAADHSELVPDSLVEHFAIAGTAEECAEQIRRISATAVNEIAVVPYVPAGQGRESAIHAFSEAAAVAASGQE
jgi:5,10-methylenetetrahydromethanopterin reductase